MGGRHQLVMAFFILSPVVTRWPVLGSGGLNFWPRGHFGDRRPQKIRSGDKF